LFNRNRRCIYYKVWCIESLIFSLKQKFVKHFIQIMDIFSTILRVFLRRKYYISGNSMLRSSAGGWWWRRCALHFVCDFLASFASVAARNQKKISRCWPAHMPFSPYILTQYMWKTRSQRKILTCNKQQKQQQLQRW